MCMKLHTAGEEVRVLCVTEMTVRCNTVTGGEKKKEVSEKAKEAEAGN